jgi:18S rRNA (adenine1779-N6/adenine1780-N6)-dimethyltransferase
MYVLFPCLPLAFTEPSQIPQVESSVVRLTPISPPPPVRFEEFDGLTRILFTRRNKTCRANFQASNVDKMMRDNWIRWRKEKKAAQIQGGMVCSLLLSI